ncbi:MAG: sialate O-acetylesterase [Pseudomonadota bacterium]
MSTGLIRRVLLGVALVLLVIFLARFTGLGKVSEKTKLSLKLEKIIQVDSEATLSCAKLAAQKPLVILALGQSNAANHGARGIDTDVPVALIAGGKCIMAVDPLPGATGLGGSIWYRLPRHFAELEPRRAIVMAVLAVDATSINEWTNQKSLLRERLSQQLKSMQTLGLAPRFILWQQGEADAIAGTSREDYSAGLDQLAGILDQEKIAAPIVLARSTVCRTEPNPAIRAAIEEKVVSNPRFKLGPDTDYDIHEGLRVKKCHFSTEGLDRAAQLWADTIAALAAKP